MGTESPGNFWRSLRHAFRPLPMQAKAAIAILFIWMLALTAGLTIALARVVNVQGELHDEQQVTAKTTHTACERARLLPHHYPEALRPARE
jgi:hypothetical protein